MTANLAGMTGGMTMVMLTKTEGGSVLVNTDAIGVVEEHEKGSMIKLRDMEGQQISVKEDPKHVSRAIVAARQRELKETMKTTMEITKDMMKDMGEMMGGNLDLNNDL